MCTYIRSPSTRWPEEECRTTSRFIASLFLDREGYRDEDESFMVQQGDESFMAKRRECRERILSMGVPSVWGESPDHISE